MNRAATGIAAALGSAIFLGLTPVLGKLAMLLGFSPLAVVAWRTALAALGLLAFMLLAGRSLLYIFPAGLFGCLLAGALNGMGSILYYLALNRLSASVGQMLYSLYPFFLAIWLALDGQPLGRLTLFRMALATLGVLLLTALQPGTADILGIAMMLGAAAFFALHLPINQRVLYEAPALTVTLYTLLAMSAVVVPVYLVFDHQFHFAAAAWRPVVGLTVVTALSRLSLFVGVKRIGGMQTALLVLAELLVAVVISRIWLHDTLGPAQWMGGLVLAASLALVKFEHPAQYRNRSGTGWFAWIRPPDLPRDAPWTAHD